MTTTTVSTSAATQSRLATCPICFKHAHVALIDAHVERCLEVRGGKDGANARGEDGGAVGARSEARERRESMAHASSSVAAGETRDAAADGAVRGGVLRNLAAARRRETVDVCANASHSDARGVDARVGDVFSDFKRRRAALADATNGATAFRRTRESVEACAKTRVDASTQTCTFIEPEEEVDVDKAVEDVEGGAPSKVSFELRVMSGNHEECGICLTRFDDDEGVVRHVFYPCQHTRQCGECALRVWQVPKAKRKCPWCKSKIEIRPKPFKPFM